MFVKKGVVFPLGSAGEVDDAHIIHPAVVVFNNRFYMYYTSHDGVARTALAISRDGVNFVKKGIVVPIGGAGEVDDVLHYKKGATVVQNIVYLYYQAHDGIKYRTALAISRDGVNFVKKGIVLPLGAGGEVDDVETAEPSIVYYHNMFYLYYLAVGGNYKIALAISRDGVNFVKKGIVLPLGAGGEVDDVGTSSPGAFVMNDNIYLYYGADDGLKMRTALAISRDGVNFVKKGIVLPLGAGGEVDDVEVYKPSPVLVNDKVYLYHSVFDGSKYRNALAISEDGM